MDFAEALLHSECPICLQRLNVCLKDDTEGSISATTSSSALSSSSMLTGTSIATIYPSSPSLPGTADGDASDGFNIMYAPSVLIANPQLANSVRRSAVVAGCELAKNDANADESGGDDGGGVVVLFCGHLLHYLCATQLCEYTEHPSCPVCRTVIASTDEMVRFSPRQRPSAVQKSRDAAASAMIASVQSPLSPPATAAIKVRSTQQRCASVSESSFGSGVSSVVQDGTEEGADGRGATCRPSKRSRHEEGHRIRNPVAETEVIVDVDGEQHHDGEVSVSSTKKTSGAADIPRGDADDAVEQSGRRRQRRSSSCGVTDDITIVGARQRLPSEAYCSFLNRMCDPWQRRSENLRARAVHLASSAGQLEADNRELEATLMAARRRREVLNLAFPEQNQLARASDQRLCDLRQLARESQASLSTSTAELVAAVREHGDLQRQVEKYQRKLSRLRTKGCDSEVKRET